MFLHTAPPSNYHVFRPADTGSPRWDLYDHISRLPQTARMDFEDHSLAGGLIIRVEPDLGYAAEREAEVKIVSVPYAARVFGNTEDAVEFIRCVNLIAGAEAQPFNFQVVASYFYGEARTRPVSEVLKEMVLLALEMTAVTATEEERRFGDVSETLLDVSEGDSQLSQSDRRALSQRRAAEVLGETEDETSVFELELRAVTRFRVRTSGFAYDEFAAYLTGCESLLESADEVDALYDSFESVHEQYDEDHVVSLHMSDGEFVRCVGALDDDVDADSLPEESRRLARELYRLYTKGFPLRDRGEESGVEGIVLPSHRRDPRTRECVEATVDETRHGVTTRTLELRHALRCVDVPLPASRLHEQTGAAEVCPHATKREQTSRAPEANREHTVTCAEEAVALYTLRALRRGSNASDPALDEEFSRRAFLPHERAAAIDTVGARLAQDYRSRNARLNAFASLESENERLLEGAARFREQARETPEFKSLLKALRAQERDNGFAERDALVRGNNVFPSASGSARPGSSSSSHSITSQTAFSNYPELVGQTRPTSDYVALRDKNERANQDLRQQLTTLLINPGTERALAETARQIEESARHFRGLTGRDVENSREAREALAPGLRWMRSTLDLLAEERAGINVARTRPVGEKQRNPLYVALPEHGNRRLAVENVNEYRTLTSVAESLETNVLAFTSSRGREITGASEAREAELNFARDYVAYRQFDDTTRKLNEHRLFREYGARLGGAQSASELLAMIKEIRQDNYARARHPERYRDEVDAARRRGEQPRRPLTEREMQQLFLDLTPGHFTSEMREVLLNHSGTSRDKAERIKGLESRTLAPSASLRLLLAEFARARSEDLARFGSNIRSFLADYLNPPTPGRLRFSAYNLFKLREKLSPAERDYFYNGGGRRAAVSHLRRA